jgi:transcriptional regulator with XRE-family HTH domain
MMDEKLELEKELDREGISVSWLANRIGLSRPTLAKSLKKPDEFKIKHIRRIAKILGVTERYAINKYFKSQNYE